MTDQEYDVTVQGWSLRHALRTLDISEIPFDIQSMGESTNHGASLGRRIAVNHDESSEENKNFLGYVPRTLLHVYLHEIAHVVMEHTASDDEADYTDRLRNVAEVEAEGTVIAIADLLGLSEDEVSRKSCRSAIFQAANMWKFAVEDETGDLPAPVEIVNASKTRVEQAAAAIAAAGVSK